MSDFEENEDVLDKINSILMGHDVSLELEPHRIPVGDGITLSFDIQPDWGLRVIIEANDLRKIRFLGARRVKLFNAQTREYFTRSRLLLEESTGGWYALFSGLEHNTDYYMFVA